MKSDEMHVKAAADAQAALKKKAEEEKKLEESTPENGVLAQIDIVFMKDGTFHMNGPWENRMIFEWCMMTAERAVTQQFDRLATEQARRNAPRIQRVEVPPGLADKLRTKGP